MSKPRVRLRFARLTLAGVSVTFRVTAPTSANLNPDAWNFTLYVPGGTSENLYTPSPLAVVVRD